jgi:hypothetical protein
MDHRKVPSPQVRHLTCDNTSTNLLSHARNGPSRAPVATQSATHFDLAPHELADTERAFETRFDPRLRNLKFKATVSVSEYSFNSIAADPTPALKTPNCNQRSAGRGWAPVATDGHGQRSCEPTGLLSGLVTAPLPTPVAYDRLVFRRPSARCSRRHPASRRPAIPLIRALGVGGAPEPLLGLLSAPETFQ